MTELELYLELENRRNGNRQKGAPGEILVTGGNMASLMNYSSTGLRFVGTNEQAQKELDLQLHTRRGVFFLKGRMAWSKPIGPKRKVVGVAFTESDDLMRLQSLVETP